jgi:rhodanese-related sulfurtransferase
MAALKGIPLPEFEPEVRASRSAYGVPVPKVASAARVLCNDHHPVIPTLKGRCEGGIPRIAPETLKAMLVGRYDEEIGNLYVIDCRYGYEFLSGHIRCALHINTAEKLRDIFFSDLDPNSILVFHCELSCDRGPKLAGIMREIDRTMNRRRVPRLFYPSVFILDGGYREFSALYPKECNGYRAMRDPRAIASGEMAGETTAWRKMLVRYETWKQTPVEAMHVAFWRRRQGLPSVEEEAAAKEEEAGAKEGEEAEEWTLGGRSLVDDDDEDERPVYN